MFTEIVKFASESKIYKQPYLDDFFDSLSYRYSSTVLVFAMLLTIFKQYFIEPITCYIATNHGGKNIMNYVQSYCFVEGTIAIADDFFIPTKLEDWEKLAQNKKITYYQWVPILLGIQAMMCYFPHILWKMLNSPTRQSQIKKMVEDANQAKTSEGDTRQTQIIRLTKALEALLFENNRQYKQGIRGCFQRVMDYFVKSRRTGQQLFNLYIFIKLLYVLNAFCQILIMNRFLSWHNRKYSLLGYGIITDILSGKDWKDSLVFPRVAYCVVPLRTMAGTNHLLAQCALPLNMLNEKIYVFLWILFSTLSILTMISFVKLLITRFYQQDRTEFIKKYLKLSENFHSREINKKKLKIFEEKFFKNDGIFLFNILSRHSGDVITAEILRQLWDKFNKNCNQIFEEKIINLCRVPLMRQNEVDASEPLATDFSSHIPIKDFTDAKY